jgi:hypothetical protein
MFLSSSAKAGTNGSTRGGDRGRDYGWVSGAARVTRIVRCSIRWRTADEGCAPMFRRSYRELLPVAVLAVFLELRIAESLMLRKWNRGIG